MITAINRASQKLGISRRQINNGNTIKFNKEYYQPYLNNELKCFLPKTECLVIEAFNSNLLVNIAEKVYELKKLQRNMSVFHKENWNKSYTHTFCPSCTL